MRTIGSFKPDDASKTRLVAHGDYSSQNPADYFIHQSGLELIELPPGMRPAPTAARPAASAVASASGAAPLITATLDTAMLPDGLLDMIISVAKKVNPRYRSVTFDRVLNQDEDGHRRFGFYVHIQPAALPYNHLCACIGKYLIIYAPLIQLSMQIGSHTI
jgi:hypothetical protein